MQNKAIITGASGNLGDAAVKLFCNSGFDVIAVSNKKAIDNNNKAVDSYMVDLTDDGLVKEFTDVIIKKHKVIDCVLMFAGGFAAGKIEKTNSEDLGKMFSINFKTAFFLTRHLLPHFTENKKGTFIFTGSLPGMNASETTGAAAYGLSKSLLFRLAEMINTEHEKNHLQAFVLVPTTMDTPQNRLAMPGADFNKWLKPETVAAKALQACTSPLSFPGRVITFGQ